MKKITRTLNLLDCFYLLQHIVEEWVRKAFGLKIEAGDNSRLVPGKWACSNGIVQRPHYESYNQRWNPDEVKTREVHIRTYADLRIRQQPRLFSYSS